MKLSRREEMDLFAAPARPPELSGSERQKAVALLRALLTEAVANLADLQSSGGDKGGSNE